MDSLTRNATEVNSAGPSKERLEPDCPRNSVTTRLADRSVEDFLATYRTVTLHDSECLIGRGATEQILTACVYCRSLDERGVPQWDARDWARLYLGVFAEGGASQ